MGQTWPLDNITAVPASMGRRSGTQQSLESLIAVLTWLLLLLLHCVVILSVHCSLHLTGLWTTALQPLLAWAEVVVPSKHWASTPLFLFGTAGLRVLTPDSRTRLLTNVQTALQASVFRQGAQCCLCAFQASNHSNMLHILAQMLDVYSPNSVLAGFLAGRLTALLQGCSMCLVLRCSISLMQGCSSCLSSPATQCVSQLYPAALLEPSHALLF